MSPHLTPQSKLQQHLLTSCPEVLLQINDKIYVIPKNKYFKSNILERFNDEIMYVADPVVQMKSKVATLTQQKRMQFLSKQTVNSFTKRKCLDTLKDLYYPTWVDEFSDSEIPLMSKDTVNAFSLKNCVRLDQLREKTLYEYNAVSLRVWGDDSPLTKVRSTNMQSVGLIFSRHHFKHLSNEECEKIYNDFFWHPDLTTLSRTGGTQADTNTLLRHLGDQFKKGKSTFQPTLEFPPLTIESFNERVDAAGAPSKKLRDQLQKQCSVDKTVSQDNTDLPEVPVVAEETFPLHFRIRVQFGDDKELLSVSGVSASNNGMFAEHVTYANKEERLNFPALILQTHRTVLGNSLDFGPGPGGRIDRIFNSKDVSRGEWLQSRAERIGRWSDKELQREGISRTETPHTLADITREGRVLLKGVQCNPGLLGNTSFQRIESDPKLMELFGYAETWSDMMHCRGQEARNLFDQELARLHKEHRDTIETYLKKGGLMMDTMTCAAKYYRLLHILNISMNNDEEKITSGISNFPDEAIEIFKTFVMLCELLNHKPHRRTEGLVLATLLTASKYGRLTQIRYDVSNNAKGDRKMTRRNMLGKYRLGLLLLAIGTRVLSPCQADCEQCERKFKDLKDAMSNRNNRCDDTMRAAPFQLLAKKIHDDTNTSSKSKERLVDSKIKRLAKKLSPSLWNYSTDNDNTIIIEFTAAEASDPSIMFMLLKYLPDYLVAEMKNRNVNNQNANEQNASIWFENGSFDENSNNCSFSVSCNLDMDTTNFAKLFDASNITKVEMEHLLLIFSRKVLVSRSQFFPGWRNASFALTFLKEKVQDRDIYSHLLHKFLSSCIENLQLSFPEVEHQVSDVPIQFLCDEEGAPITSILAFKCPNCDTVKPIAIDDEDKRLLRKGEVRLHIHCNCEEGVRLLPGVLGQLPSQNESRSGQNRVRQLPSRFSNQD